MSLTSPDMGYLLLNTAPVDESKESVVAVTSLVITPENPELMVTTISIS